jgi:regulator of replication initiation timing
VTIAKLKKTIANKNEELAQLRADVPALVRVVNQLTLESQQLREALVNPDTNLIPTEDGDHPAPTSDQSGSADPRLLSRCVCERVSG